MLSTRRSLRALCEEGLGILINVCDLDEDLLWPSAQQNRLNPPKKQRHARTGLGYCPESHLQHPLFIQINLIRVQYHSN